MIVFILIESVTCLFLIELPAGVITDEFDAFIIVSVIVLVISCI